MWCRQAGYYYGKSEKSKSKDPRRIEEQKNKKKMSTKVFGVTNVAHKNVVLSINQTVYNIEQPILYT